MNKEEVIVGCWYGLAWVAFLGWWVIPVVAACGYLWAKGGDKDTSKAWRRWGVPVVTCCAIALVRASWIPLVAILPYYGVLTIGYGIPSVNPLPDGDEGSWLGRYWTKVVTGSTNPPPKEDEAGIDVRCRGTLALFAGLSMCPLAFLSFPGWCVGVVVLLVGVFITF